MLEIINLNCLTFYLVLLAVPGDAILGDVINYQMNAASPSDFDDAIIVVVIRVILPIFVTYYDSPWVLEASRILVSPAHSPGSKPARLLPQSCFPFYRAVDGIRQFLHLLLFVVRSFDVVCALRVHRNPHGHLAFVYRLDFSAFTTSLPPQPNCDHRDDA